jgi:flagellar biosynthesis/type III secretory pathway chaperone
MSDDYSDLADALRAEIVEYGGLLNSFDEQQRLLIANDAEGVLRLSTALEKQVATLQVRRTTREELVAALARALGQPEGATLRSLLASIEPGYRPMLEALIKEVNVLVHRVRRINRHNHTLLTAAVSSRREILRALRPEAFVQTYSPTGSLSATSAPASLKASG